jgi:hypothetical protein
MADNKKTTPPAADPRAGRNAGYAEEQPRDRGHAQAKAPKPAPNPDEPGIDRDTDAQLDPAKSDKTRH